MASPPPSLPRHRPPLALPGHGQPRSRKASIASATSSSHPLRQTSFPPPNSLEAQHQLAVYSPSQGSIDDFSDSEIVSAISGPADDGATRKRKRGEKRPRGRPRGGGRTRSLSFAVGEDGRRSTGPGTGTPSAAAGSGEQEDEEDDGDDEEVATGGRIPLYEGGQMSQAELLAENQQRAMFSEHIGYVDSLPLSRRKGLTTGDHSGRYEAFGRSKLRTADVRRLVNQTLSQSVPPNIITVVSSYTKLFAGMLVQEARQVQAEWEACNPKRADGVPNPLYERLNEPAAEEDEDKENDTVKDVTTNNAAQEPEKHDGDASSFIKREKLSSSPMEIVDSSIPRPGSAGESNATKSMPIFPGGAGGLSSSLQECDRGPLQPDHLREALRRYKKARKGGTVGFTGLSLEGRDIAAAQMGGKRLFR